MSTASWMTFRIAEQSKSTNAKSNPKGTPLKKNAMNGRFKNVVSNLNWLRKSRRKPNAIKYPKSCALRSVADSFRDQKNATLKRKRLFTRYRRKHVNLHPKNSANLSQNWYHISNQSKSVQMYQKKFVQNPNLL